MSAKLGLYHVEDKLNKKSFSLRVSSTNVGPVNPADLVTFTEKVLNAKLCFYAVMSS